MNRLKQFWCGLTTGHDWFLRPFFGNTIAIIECVHCNKEIRAGRVQTGPRLPEDSLAPFNAAVAEHDRQILPKVLGVPENPTGITHRFRGPLLTPFDQKAHAAKRKRNKSTGQFMRGKKKP